MKLLVAFLLPLAAAEPEVASLGWMSGCWVMERNGVKVEEHWSKPAGDVMLGYSRTMRPGRPTFYEQLRIGVREGVIQYVPIVGKQGPIEFALKKSAENEAVFENPAHDYPQRIAYVRSGDELRATTSTLDETKPRPQRFVYKRVACD
ncbi:MAG: hypothetical protein FJW36_00785 [Acidobacteria bacterium]|nr:hypothetical protein [Acidobacteriota bacterium]